MTRRGDATRVRLLEATRSVVREVGYAHATTRAIAAEAGVAEGTIYRHFPDKAALFFAAVFDANSAVIDEVAALPGRAGSGSVEANLASALRRLASLREDILPLELAISADPELAGRRDAIMAGSAPPMSGPPMALVDYLAAEQRLGRVRGDIDPWQVTTVVLAALFGLGVAPDVGGRADAIDLLAGLVANGLGPHEPPSEQRTDR